MRFKTIFFLTLLGFHFCGVCCSGYAEDESLSQKAANQVIDSLPDFIKDVQAMRNMTPQQKIDYLMGAVDDRVKEKVSEKFKDQIKDKVKDFTRAALRARAFQEFGIPQIRNAFVLGEAVNWGKIESEIVSNVDTKMRMFDAGWKAAEIGWGAYEAYATGDAVAAAKSISGSVCELLAEAYIPGWGWIKFGAKMVEALGNYVLSYATDTAVQGMLEDMYGMKSNPSGFADWLIKQSPQAIMADLNSKWDDGMAFGYLWQGQGTDKGDEEMKSRLQSVLVGLRGQLLAKIKEEEAKEKELQQYMEQYNQETEKRAKDLQSVAKQATDEAEKILAPVKSFREKYYGIRKQEVQQQETRIRSQMVGGAGIAYSSLNYKGLVNIYRNALSEVKDGPSKSGFDKEAYERMYNEYGPAVAKELKRFSETNEAAIQAAGKAMWAAWGPQFDALSTQINAAFKRGDHRTVEALNNQLAALNARFAPVQQAHAKAVSEARTKMALEEQLLGTEYTLATLEATERGAKFGMRIVEAYKSINDQLSKANTELGLGLKILRENIHKLNYPGLWRHAGSIAGAIGGGYSGPAEQLRKGEYEFFVGPGHLSGAIANAEEEERKLKADLEKLSELDSAERKLYAAYRQVVANAFNSYQAVTPERLQVIHKPPIFSGDQEENRRNSMIGAARSGNPSSLGDEYWGIADFPYVSFPGGYPRITGTIISLEFLNQIDSFLGNPSEPYREALKKVQQDITALRGWAETDELAGIINQLGPRLSKLFDQYAYFGEGIPGIIYKFRALPEGKGGQGTIIDERTVLDTAGYVYLQEMKEVWEKNGHRVAQFANLAKGYGKGHNYPRDYNPKRYIDKLPTWQGIPQKIQIYEQAMIQAIKESKEAYAQARKQIDELKDQFEQSRSGFGAMNLKNMQNVQKTLKLIIQYNLVAPGYTAMKDEILQFEKDMEEGIATWLEEQKKKNEEYQRRQAEEAKFQAEEARKQEEARNQDALKRTNPAEYYGYRVVSSRLNTYSVDGVSGDIIVTRDKLVQGQLHIDAQLSHTDKAKTLLFSEDGGRTWKEIPLSANIRYSFYPMPNRLYNPFVQIKTEDLLVVNLKLIPSANGIIYKDEDFNQQVVAAVKALAEAYERRDLSGFSDLISRNYAGNKTFLEEGVRFDFDLFLNISLKIYINRIEQRGDRFVVETKWDKSQTPRQTGQTQKTTGRTTIMFVVEDGKLKVQNLRGDLLYATLSPEIAQASGLSSAKVEEIRTARDERNPIQPGAGTTDDDGGIASPAATLTVTTKSLEDDYGTGGMPDQHIDFATGNVILGGAGGDIGLEVNGFWAQIGAGIKEVGTSFNATTDASGVTALDNSVFGLTTGKVYIFLTTGGYYGKLEVISWDEEDRDLDTVFDTSIVQFRYAVQTNGTSDVTTQ